MRQILSGVLVVGMGLVPVTVPLMVQQSWAQTQELQAEWEALVDQAIQQTRIGQYRQAIETWQQVLDLARQLNDRQLEALAMLGIGFNYEQLDQYQKALDYYNQALPIFQEVGDQASVATTLNNIGRVYHAIGQPQKALESYNQALPIRQEVGDRAGVATTFNNIGVVYRAMGQPQKALESYNQALPIHREMGDRAGVASTLNNIGGVYHAIGQPQKALESYNQALPIFQQVGDRAGVATTLNNIGAVYRAMGQPQKALESYNQALPISHEVGDRAGVAITLHNIGAVYNDIGQPQKALESYNQALPILREVGNRAGVATTLNNIGVVYNDIGQPQKALDYYNQALPIRREVGDRAGVATTLNNIGGVYYAIGQPQKALESYNQALPIFQQVGNRTGIATTLNNIGVVYNDIGQPQKALESYNQALPIRREVGDRPGIAATLNNIGGVYHAIGQPQKALESYNQALPILREVGNRAGVAATLNNIGAVYDAIGQPQKALESYNQALPISREVGNRTGVATTLSSIGAVYRAIGQPQKALDYYNQAVTITLEMRQGLQRGNRQSFLGNEPGSVIALTNLLIDQNQPKQAFEWINLYSTAELADYTRLIDAQVSNPQAQKSLDQWNQKNQQLEIFRQQLQENFSEERSRQFREFEAQVNQEAEDISRQYPEVAELLETTPDDLEQLQSSIPDGTVVIQPVLLTNIKDVPNNIAIFILTKDQPITVKKVPVDPDQLDNLITDYREIVQNRYATGFRDRGSELYDLLIRPIEDQIQSFSPSKIAIIATGKLRYIPFETLYNRDTGKFLIETYPINYFTRLSVNSLQLTDIGNSPSLQHGALGLGNPIPEEPYNLPGAEAEIKNLPNLLPRSEIYLGNDATVERFKYHAPRFPVIHLATHGCFQAEGCCLGEKEDCNGVRRIDMEPNTLLFADEPFNIANAARLGMKNTELLVLSACQTALREESDGREIAGIAYLFERAGAKAVMASLWNAEDETTSEIMTQFYQNLNQGMSKGEALRQAKLQQIDRHPFYWSPFILIGNAQ